MKALRDILRIALDSEDAEFREGQEESILAALRPPHRALVVQATGWGKSMVYFVATKVLRDQGRGPTLVVSPLLALMRDQKAAALRLGLQAGEYSTSNREEWPLIEQRVHEDSLDLLLVSPERLANDSFVKLIEGSPLSKAGLVVVDEAHCISDWGHDFRPDYQRIGGLIRRLPPTTSVLATTATANNRVVKDVLDQIGQGTPLIRGSLARNSLRIQVFQGLRTEERLAWLDTHLASLPGSGIIYTLTIRDAEKVAHWLQSRGHSVLPYHGQLQTEERAEREDQLRENRIKALSATIALGMGFDKPDLGFVIHYQSPGSLVAYYQQIGRAGRAIDDALAVLFMGDEDEAIHEYFRSASRPSAEDQMALVSCLEDAENGLRQGDLLAQLNWKSGRLTQTLKLLTAESPSPIATSKTGYVRSASAWQPDQEKDKALRERAEEERSRFVSFASSPTCWMELVRRELDDPTAEPCGKCGRCTGEVLLPEGYEDESLKEALLFLNKAEFIIEPRRQWKGKQLAVHGFSGNIKEDLRCAPGLCLSHFGDPGIAQWVKEGKEEGVFRDDLVSEAAGALSRALPDEQFDWVCCVPSLRDPRLVRDFAAKLAVEMKIPFRDVVKKVRPTEPQKRMENSYRQTANLAGAFEVDGVQGGSVLLVDDYVDSRWTVTVIGALLRQAGADKVTPLALSSSQNQSDED